MVGASVGDIVAALGEALGFAVGLPEWAVLGLPVGEAVTGFPEGALVGFGVG